MTPLQTRRRHHRALTNIYNLLDENEKDQEKIEAIYKNNEEQKSTKGKDIQQKIKKIQWESQIN